MQQRVYEKVLLDSVFHGIQKIQGELKKIIFNKHDEFSSVKKVEFTVKKQGLCEAGHNVISGKHFNYHWWYTQQ